MSAADIKRLAVVAQTAVTTVEMQMGVGNGAGGYSKSTIERCGLGDREAVLIVRALLIALRQPSESMIDAACSNSTAYRHQLEEGWADMIDTLLGET